MMINLFVQQITFYNLQPDQLKDNDKDKDAISKTTFHDPDDDQVDCFQPTTFHNLRHELLFNYGGFLTFTGQLTSYSSS